MGMPSIFLLKINFKKVNTFQFVGSHSRMSFPSRRNFSFLSEIRLCFSFSCMVSLTKAPDVLSLLLTLNVCCNVWYFCHLTSVELFLVVKWTSKERRKSWEAHSSLLVLSWFLSFFFACKTTPEFFFKAGRIQSVQSKLLVLPYQNAVPSFLQHILMWSARWFIQKLIYTHNNLHKYRHQC